MKVGTFYFPTDYGIEVGELARALEERGFDSLFLCEHTHIPVSRRTPFPSGGELPKRYLHAHDPFVALAYAAGMTKNLLLGTGVCLVSQRDPIVTAKTVASLDRLSGGRFMFGIGAGWNAEEMENHGTEYRMRFKLMRERILAMKADKTRLGGGLALHSAFGTFYVPNISSDPKDGIGAWTDAQFVTAMTKGTSPAGEHLYPAFPYPSYQHMRFDDSQAP